MSPDLPALVAQGLSDPAIAARLGVSARTVLRWRKRAGLASLWAPERAEHATVARYRAGCRCEPCTAANTADCAIYRNTYKRATTSTAINGSKPWSAADDRALLESAGRVVDVAQRLGRTYNAAQLRLYHLRQRERLDA